MDSTEANRQRKLLESHTRWVQDEGGLELPVRIDTYLDPRQQRRIGWLKAHATGRILDVGCSWGYALAYMGGDVGVDINPHLAAFASILAPHRTFVAADARDLPHEDKSFDTVVMAETLEHLEWPDGVNAAINEAKRVARQRVLITTPGPDSDEADSFKHLWIATPDKQERIACHFSNVTIVLRDGFFMLRGDLVH